MWKFHHGALPGAAKAEFFVDRGHELASVPFRANLVGDLVRAREAVVARRIVFAATEPTFEDSFGERRFLPRERFVVVSFLTSTGCGREDLNRRLYIASIKFSSILFY